MNAAERSHAAAHAAWIAYHRATGQQPSAGSLQDLLEDLIGIHAEYTGECPFEVAVAEKAVARC